MELPALFCNCKEQLVEFRAKFMHYSWLKLNSRLKRRSRKIVVDIWATTTSRGERFFAQRFIVRNSGHYDFFKHVLYALGHTIYVSTTQDDISTENYTSESDAE